MLYKDEFPSALKRKYYLNWMLRSLFPYKFAEPFLNRQAQKIEQDLDAYLERNCIDSKIEEVDRVNNISKDDFINNYFNKNLPVIFSNGAADWVCKEKWTFDFFENNCGDLHALLVDAEGLTGYETKGDYDVLHLRDLIKSIKEGGQKYLRFSPLISRNKFLIKDINLKWLRKMRAKFCVGEGFQLFIGPGNKETPLHNAITCNLFVMLQGEKHWRLYPAHMSPLLKPAAKRTVFHSSAFNFKKPDSKEYPLAKYLSGFDAFLKAGDILFVPPYMWHHVCNTTPSIAFGYRYNNYPSALRSSKTLSLSRVLANDPPLWRSFFYDFTDFNLVWAHSLGRHKKVLEKLANLNKK